jgi:hypothetical protein
VLTVQEVISATDKDLGTKGMFTSYKLSLQSGETAELFQRKDSPAPVAGQSIDATLEDGPYGKKIKKNSQIGGFGGARARDPKETSRIQRQHSQEMAIRWAALAYTRGKLPEEFTITNLTQLIDWFQLDIEREPVKYGELKRKEPQHVGGTDVPADSESFVHAPQDMSGTPWATSD